MKTKHTPGPWRVNGSNIEAPVPFKANCVEFVLKEGYQPILGMDPRVILAYLPWIQFEEKRWREMQAANARLIAAAPDLLAALCDAHDHLIAYSPAGSSDTLIKHIRALVARVDDESPENTDPTKT
jgi:hypothetical protein